MIELKLQSPQQVAPSKDIIYLSKESSPSEKKIVYTKGTASLPAHYRKDEMDFYFKYQDQVGAIDLIKIISGHGYGMSALSFESGIWSPPKTLTISDILSQMRPNPILTDEIVIVPLREIPRDNAKKEIAEYIQRAKGRKVYISELAEELRLDIELIMEIIEELEAETRD